jgi:hypothetical protein
MRNLNDTAFSALASCFPSDKVQTCGAEQGL